MSLEIGQKWISKTHPHESFEIYDGIIDYCDCKADYDPDYNKHAQKCRVLFWKRIDGDAYENFLMKKIGRRANTYPYAWNGECKVSVLQSKIKKYNMTLECLDV